MSTKSNFEDALGDSWVDLSNSGRESLRSATPVSVSYVFTDETLKLLRDAQRDSSHSSSGLSPVSSQTDSPHSSPKSPPNSPIHGGTTQLVMDWQNYYVNPEARDFQDDGFSTWCSRPDQLPPKNWNFKHPKNTALSIRYARVGENSVFSRKGLCTLFLTNLLSLLLGAGVGVWLTKYGFFVPAVRAR